jgi:hypothetical protein
MIRQSDAPAPGKSDGAPGSLRLEPVKIETSSNSPDVFRRESKP